MVLGEFWSMMHAVGHYIAKDTIELYALDADRVTFWAEIYAIVLILIAKGSIILMVHAWDALPTLL